MDTKGLDISNIVTLDDDKRYMVLDVINVDNTDYVSLVEVNDPSNFKLLEKFTRDGELVLREVIDEIKLEKVKLQALKKFAGIIKDVQLNRLGGNEKMNNIKTPKEYKIKKIEELRETLPCYEEELMFKFFSYTTVLTLNDVVSTNLQPLYSVLPITIIACFINTLIRKYHNLMEIDRLRTDLKLDEATESEFIRILEDKKQELSEMNKENNSRLVINCIIGVVSIISACMLGKLDVPELTTLLSLIGTYGLLGFVGKSCEIKQIDMRLKQIEEKQELFDFQRIRKQ